MQMVDFEYDGVRLSDYGMTIGSFDSSIDDIQNVGNSISLNQVKAHYSDEFYISGYQYEEPLQTTFSVIKKGCNTADESISDMEFGHLMRWLNRKTYSILRPIYDDDSFMDLYFMGTFNVMPIKVSGLIIGLELTFNANAPYGYYNSVTYAHIFQSSDDIFEINDYSEEIGHIYCDATIKILEDGFLKITNDLDTDNPVTIQNCKSGEIITMKGKPKIINTSLASHNKLYNDFNFNFLRIKNYPDNVTNRFHSSLRCEISLTYSPIRKVGLIL